MTRKRTLNSSNKLITDAPLIPNVPPRAPVHKPLAPPRSSPQSLKSSDHLHHQGKQVTLAELKRQIEGFDLSFPVGSFVRQGWLGMEYFNTGSLLEKVEERQDVIQFSL